MNSCVRVAVVLLGLCGSAAPAGAQAVQGWFDGVWNPTCTIWGWARDSANSAPIQVRIYLGEGPSGLLVTTLLADRPRPDLPFPDQNHGFEHSFTAAEINAAGLADGQPHPLYAYGVSHSGAVVALTANGKPVQCVSLSNVSVDFSIPVQVKSASGFLLAAPFSEAGAARVRPLQPKLWRFTDAFVNGKIIPFPTIAQLLRSTFPNITLNLLMPIATWGFGSNPAVWLNWPGYEQFVRNTAQAYKNANLDAIIEVWNEPDYPMFWSGTRAQFFETYLRTYTVLRAELGPNAIIAGPSFGTYDRTAIVNFLEYCLANGCEVNSLTWHALDDGNVAALPARVADARVSFLQNSRYAPLKIQRIDINEIVGPVYTYQPAGTLHHYDAFEASGADGAVHACWDDSNGTSGCYNSTFDGLLTPGTLMPRAAWWTHKAYADGVADRVQAAVQDDSTGARTVALASRAIAGLPMPQILIGYADFGKTVNNATGRLKVHLEINHLAMVPSFAGAATARLLVERIPPTGEAMLTAPVFIQQTQVAIIDGRAQLDLPVLNVGDVLRITAVGGAFTDDPIVQGSTTIRAVHIHELRARIDGQRGRVGLQPFGWAEPIVTSGVTTIRAQHVVELRSALAQAYAAAGGIAPPPWAEPTLTGSVTVKSTHLAELRAALATLEQR
jgi:xylan 1,4-beta-xylosidase